MRPHATTGFFGAVNPGRHAHPAGGYGRGVPEEVAATAREELFAVSWGERTVPDVWHERYWWARHEVVYRWLRPRVAGCRVLEAGSGEGYGAALLAETARHVLALDYDAHATTHHRRVYPHVPVLRANLVALPMRSASCDVVVSLQTVEHLWDQPALLRECARVLAPGGWCALSTPNRRTFPEGNLFHTRELAAGELTALAATAFASIEMLGVAHGPRLRAWEARHGSVVDAQLAAPPQAWAADVAQQVASTTAADFDLHPDSTDQPLEDALDLVAVLR